MKRQIKGGCPKRALQQKYNKLLITTEEEEEEGGIA